MRPLLHLLAIALLLGAGPACALPAKAQDGGQKAPVDGPDGKPKTDETAGADEEEEKEEPPEAPKEEPPPEPAPPPAPATPAPPAPTGVEEAGLLKVPGGEKVTIGLDRKELAELVKNTSLGSMSNVAGSIEQLLSVSTPRHVVRLPPFYIGKYEVTSAQYHLFLQQAARVEVVIPQRDRPGPRTLEEVARKFLISPAWNRRDGSLYFPVAVDWDGLYDLNEAVLAPPGNKDNPPKEAFQKLPLPPGTKLIAYRHTIPHNWAVRVMEGKKSRLVLKDQPPPGKRDHPATGVSLVDALACARFYGCHIPREFEWEAAARGPKDSIWPMGAWDPLALAWGQFNTHLFNAKAEARKKMKNPERLLPAELARLQWILRAKDLEDAPEPPVFSVGSFPFGAAPCGALDLLSNADEWVSSRLFGYPGTDSKANGLMTRSSILRGGNFYSKDTMLQATYRMYYDDSKNLYFTPYVKFSTSGFRMARYTAFGASFGAPASQRLLEADPPILPADRDPKSMVLKPMGLDIYRAVGADRLTEVAWSAAGSPAQDPADKVFYTGQAYGFAFVPVDAVPFRDAAAIRKAAEHNTMPPAGEKKPDPRRPRSLPLFGVLSLTPGVDIKGDVLMRVEKEEPIPPEDYKRMLEEWEARKKAAEDAKKEKPEPEKPEEPKDGDGKSKTEGEEFAFKGGSGGGKAPPPPKGGTPKPPAGGEKPADGEKPGEADPPADDEEEDKPVEEPPPPKTRKVMVDEYRSGVVKGADFPDGLLVALMNVKGQTRVCLWEPIGIEGAVLLTSPAAILDPGSLDYKKVGRALSPYSTIDTTEGLASLLTYIPSEKGEMFEVNLKFKLVEFPANEPASPWRAGSVK